MALYDNQPLLDDETKADILYQVSCIDKELAKEVPSEEALASEQAAWEASVQQMKAELKRRQKILAADEEAALKKLERKLLLISVTNVVTPLPKQNNLTTGSQS